jgi:predicted negative regulator of RcsB-dependent stress response
MIKIWKWVKENVTSILISIIAILGAGIFWKYHKKKVAEVRDSSIVKNAQIEIASLEERRKELVQHKNLHQYDIINLDEKLLANKRKIVEAHDYIETLSDEDILNELTRLGY